MYLLQIIHATLQNYGIEEHIEDGNQRCEPHHNWVDEVVRSEARAIANIGTDVSPSATAIMPRLETKDSSKLTRYRTEFPEHFNTNVFLERCREVFLSLGTLLHVAVIYFFSLITM